MGVFKKLFGGGGVRCAKCGKSFSPPEQLMTIFTTDINRFSIGGVGGYCPSCRNYLCSDHLEFQQTDLSGMSWAIGCKQCRTQIVTKP